MSRGRLGALVGVVAASLAFGLVPQAQADPGDTTPSAAEVNRAQQAAQAAAGDVGRMQAKLARAQSQLDALLNDAERAVEAYNGALYQLDQAKVAAAAAQARADAAAASVAAAQREVGRFAAASYRMGGGIASFASMLDADGPQDLIDQASALASVAASNDRALDEVAAARVVAAVLEEQAAAALEEQTAAAERVRLAKVEAEAKVARQQSQIGGLERLTRQLSARLAAARAQAGSLSQQRKDGLARAAREKAAKEAKRRAAAAAAADKGNNGSNGTGDGSANNPSHWAPSFIGGTQYGTVEGAAKAIAYARDQLGKPYVWGASGPNSFDCSGLTLMAWRQGGVSLPHWTVAQWAQAKKIPASQARPGDLVFFAFDISDTSTIHHVGLYIGGGRMIHAPHTGDVVREADVYSDGLIGFVRP
jgi:peptidoglycan DL-endopeptidase CwlO